MNTVSVKLSLIREKQQFQACIAMTNGSLQEISLQLGKLHPKEKSVYQGYKYDKRKESYLLGRLSAKHAILELTNKTNLKSIWIDSGVFQFPVVKGINLQNIQVSISHCGHTGISVAFPEAHPMGIDLEKVDEEKKEAVLTQLTNKEKLLLNNQFNDNISNYTALFTIKEALSKIIRTGMMLDFKFLEIDSVKVKKDILECTFSHFGQYKAFSKIIGTYAVSIVLPKKTNVNLTEVWQMLESIKAI